MAPTTTGQTTNEQNTSQRPGKSDLTSIKADAGVQQLREQARSATTKEAVQTLQKIQTHEHAAPKHHAPIRHAHRHDHDRDADGDSERREQRAIAAAKGANVRAIGSRGAGNRLAVGTAGLALDPEALERNEKVGELLVNRGLVGTAAQQNDLTINTDSANANQQPRDRQNAPDTANGLANAVEAPIKLLELVGPQATLTFQEKLKEVWVKLDESASNLLDVIARLPANLQGQTAMDLLMVESPQGVHFVAFLKNKSDFEILATFDRRALLPNSPSRQLVEAGIHAYEQLDTIARGTGEKLEQTVRQRAQAEGASTDAVLNELRKLCIQEKRRRSTFRRMVDYLVDRLDELDLIDQGQDLASPAPEEQLAKDFGAEDKEEFDAMDSDSLVGDNRPQTGEKATFDDGNGDEDDAEFSNVSAAVTPIRQQPKADPATKSETGHSMALGAMGFGNE